MTMELKRSQSLALKPRVAVLVPCYNEEVAIKQVVRGFRESLPEARIYVFDNNSKDRTIPVAKAEGAIVRQERTQGKGNVVRRMFSDVEADIYVLVDGDATYHAPSARKMIDLLLTEHLDMVVGRRISASPTGAYRPGHQFGNALLTGFVTTLFGEQFTDILSGYRVFSRRFVKSFPALSQGFETETELTVHALELRMPVAEVDTPYGARPEGSVSKLSTYRDGWRILNTIIRLYKERQRPLQFFGIVGLTFALVSVVLAWPIFITYLETGLVPRFPTAILSTGLMLLAFLSFTSGVILDTVTRGRFEAKRLSYLSYGVYIAGDDDKPNQDNQYIDLSCDNSYASV